MITLIGSISTMYFVVGIFAVVLLHDWDGKWWQPELTLLVWALWLPVGIGAAMVWLFRRHVQS